MLVGSHVAWVGGFSSVNLYYSYTTTHYYSIIGIDLPFVFIYAFCFNVYVKHFSKVIYKKRNYHYHYYILVLFFK